MSDSAGSTFTSWMNWLGGRHTMFAGFFAVYGSLLQWTHKLDATYIAFIGTIMGFVISHSIKEDVHETTMTQLAQGDNPQTGTQQTFTPPQQPIPTPATVAAAAAAAPPVVVVAPPPQQ
jgi:hypothetical protein